MWVVRLPLVASRSRMGLQVVRPPLFAVRVVRPRSRSRAARDGTAAISGDARASGGEGTGLGGGGGYSL